MRTSIHRRVCYGADEDAQRRWRGAECGSDRALFPNAVTEVMRDGKVVRAIDFDVLRQELLREIVEGRAERYAFTWPDKSAAILAANAPIAATLRPARAESVERDGTVLMKFDQIFAAYSHATVRKVL